MRNLANLTLFPRGNWQDFLATKHAYFGNFPFYVFYVIGQLFLCLVPENMKAWKTLAILLKSAARFLARIGHQFSVFF